MGHKARTSSRHPRRHVRIQHPTMSAQSRNSLISYPPPANCSEEFSTSPCPPDGITRITDGQPVYFNASQLPAGVSSMPVAASTYLPLAPPFEPQPPEFDWGNRKFDCVADQSMPLFTTDPRGYLPQIYLPQLMGQQGWDIPTMGSSYTPMLPIHADNSLHETNQLLSPTGPLNSPFTNTGPYSNSPGTEDLQHPGDTSVFRVGDTSIPDTIPASEDPYVLRRRSRFSRLPTDSTHSRCHDE
ncbi:hypothetical protein DB88DRAFT_501556 [Papiliotrema laurentii]|uniref:Uncharacterized protein n=1 Tax=Papiliotrema laurentii TaxID=5418 RepID=A0AAD9CUQ3_PAPLA|nr:hypothetical protein DB88DRAFT_501556 [Papiliotrema laurentii]